MAAVEEHGSLPVRGGKLQPPGCGHVRGPHLRDHTGERSIAQRILGNGEDIHILSALRIEEFSWSQADLFEARGV